MSLGAPEIIIIFVLVLVFFGGKKLPEFARGLGKGLKEFKNATKDIKDEIESSTDDDLKKNS
ncbi:MAG: twin-arginine translocase TatA/TatE family subunit [Candidatus Marinimicrobia bacterium]|jgi:sec-independent protein translocase protein TatA|nr:twin-arginine translocase TatA/TatE family subunit [Candidatus Neomarinimicrobiota bacterium]|tara:strand:+ start:1042 stop:1227 length:186 start_codon:yes stop_codon:yes gene_type:complete